MDDAEMSGVAGIVSMDTNSIPQREQHSWELPLAAPAGLQHVM